MNGKAKTAQNNKPSKPAKIRNVLVQPFKIKWPLVDPDENEQLLKLLGKVPEEHVASGFKPALQQLTEAKACVLLIASDFHPQILGQQIIRMARRNSPKIGIVAVANLGWKESPEKLIAVQKTGNEQADICEILKLVSQICKSKGYDEEAPQGKVARAKERKQKKKIGSLPSEVISQMHLPRQNSKERSFVPEVSIFAGKMTNDTKKEDWGEFISFKRPRSEQMEIDINDLTIHEQKSFPKDAPNKPKKKKLGTYEPLTVNRIQGDPNRKTPKVKKNKQL